jgi:hypothetical protein
MFNLEFLVRDASSKNKIAEARVGMSNPDARSIACEVRLKPGTYEVIPKITALEVDDTKKVEDAVKEYVKSNPMKLQQMGMLYDLSHAKAGVLDEDDALLKRKDLDKQKQKENSKEEKINDMKQAMEKMQLAMAEMQLELSNNGKSKGDGKDKTDEKEQKKESAPKDQSGIDGHSIEQKPVSDAPTSGHAQITSSTSQTAKEIPGPSEGPPSAGSQVEKTTIDGEEQGAKKETGAIDNNQAANEGEQTTSVEVPGDDGGLDEQQISEEDDDDGEEGPESPWNPVCVMCLSVYAQDKGVSVKLADVTA